MNDVLAYSPPVCRTFYLCKVLNSVTKGLGEKGVNLFDISDDQASDSRRSIV